MNDFVRKERRVVCKKVAGDVFIKKKKILANHRARSLQ